MRLRIVELGQIEAAESFLVGDEVDFPQRKAEHRFVFLVELSRFPVSLRHS
jgi:hypothetical protein